nr:hypothetical protein L204_06448 [Cryptococcus depauperatus CBS 7855]
MEKCAVMGSGGVGKSAVTVRFINGSYLEWYDPTIEDSYRKQFLVDGQPCLLEILDTAGIDQYLTLNDLFIRESEGFVLVFSITQRDTFEEIARTRENIGRIKLPYSMSERLSMVIVGNKCDLTEERQVQTVEGERLAERWGCKYFETSARTSTNIIPVFSEIVRQMRRNSPPKELSRVRRSRRPKKCVIL